MKLTGSVAIVNRIAHFQGFGSSSKLGKRCKTLLQVRNNPDGSARLVLSTRKDIVAYEYPVKSIQKFRTQFIRDGIATIEISQPPMNIMIQGADSNELDKFIKHLTEIKSGKSSAPPKEEEPKAVLNTSGVANKTGTGKEEKDEAGTLRKTIAIKRPRSPELSKTEKGNIKRILSGTDKVVTVRVRENYPKEFASTLERITIQNVKLKKIDKRILRLELLTMLDLSGNSLTNVDELMKLKCQLRVLNLSSNSIDRINEDFFGSPALSQLVNLNISKNQLSKLPASLTNLQALQTLDLRQNQISYLPYNWSDMTSLKVLNVSDNRLLFLPYPILNLQLTSLDLFNNRSMFDVKLSKADYVGYSSIPTLFEVICESLMKKPRRERQALAEGLPPIVSQYLNGGKYCYECGKLSLRYKITTSAVFPEMRGCLLTPGRVSWLVKKITCFVCDTKPAQPKKKIHKRIIVAF